MSVIKSLWYIITQIFRGLFFGYKTINKGVKKFDETSFAKHLEEDMVTGLTGKSREQYRAEKARMEWESLQLRKRNQARIKKVKNVSKGLRQTGKNLSKNWRKK